MVWECISAHCIGEFYICEGTIKAEWYILLLEQHMLPPTWSKTAPSHALHLLQQDASEEKCLCAKPAPIKNIWHITFVPKLLSVWNSFIKQEWKKPFAFRSTPQLPKSYRLLLEARWCNTVVIIPLLHVLKCIQIQNVHAIYNKYKV